jgi:hypothetical protein
MAWLDHLRQRADRVPRRRGRAPALGIHNPLADDTATASRASAQPVLVALADDTEAPDVCAPV